MSVRAAELGAAVVGLGVGEAHARTLAAVPGVRLRFLYDLDAAKSSALATTLGGARAARCFDEILEDPSVQIVCIASFDQDHFRQVEAALAAGKHVFVEKPLCRSWQELTALKTAQAKAGVFLASNLLLRAAPLYRWLKTEAVEDRLGKLFAIDGDYLYGRLEKMTSGWRRDVPAYSVMQGGGIHMLDLLLWLAGDRPVSVAASGGCLAAEGTAYKYDDFHAAEFRFASGLVGRVTANFGCVHRHQHVLRVFGTKATFIFDDRGARIHESRDPNDSPRPIVLDPKPSAKGVLLPGFIAAVASGEDPTPAAQREFELIAACLAADAAKTSDRRITVEYLA